MSIIKQNKNNIIVYSLLTAIACSLYIIESFIPKPLPFFRLGLANVVVLLMLLLNKPKVAFVIAFAKTILGAFFIGIIFSPATLLGFLGALVSVSAMYIVIKLRLNLSAIGVSTIGSVCHGLTQVFAVRYLLIKNSSVFMLIPLIILISTISGCITGFLAAEIKKRIKQEHYENIY